MKKLICSLFAIGVAVSQAHSQTITVTDSVTPITELRWADTCFGLLNLSSSQISSGYLLDFAINAFNDSIFNSVKYSNVDTIRDKEMFFAIHHILVNSAVNSSAAYIGNSDSIYENAYRYYRNTGHIPLLFLYQNFQRIKPTALSQGLFTLSSDSIRLMDVSGRTTSPYDTSEIFVFAPFYTTAQTFGNITFDLPSQFWLMSGISSVQVDFGDGIGYRTLSPGASVSINYPVDSTFHMRASITNSAGTFLAHTDFVYNAPQYYIQPDTQFTVSVAPIYNNVTQYLDSNSNELVIMGSEALHWTLPEPQAPVDPPCPSTYTALPQMPLNCDINPGAQVLIFNGCDNVFDRPVIIVEGFDANQSLPYDASNTYQTFSVSSGNYSALTGNLRELGYDIVVVHFLKNNDFIENNALVLEQVITQIQNLRTGSNIGPINVIGVSMGSLVARYALRDMEVRGITLNAANYFSYDGPQQGANIPLGLQYLFNELVNDVSIATHISSNFEGLAASYFSPAAMQMLAMYPNYSNGRPSGSLLNSVRSVFAQKMLSIGYPQTTNNYGISLGMGNSSGSTNQGAGASFQFNFGGGANIFNGNMTWLFENIQSSAYALPVNNTPGTILKFKFQGFKVARIFGIKVPTLQLINRTIGYSGNYPYDNGPGGFERVQSQFVSAFNGTSSFPKNWNGPTITVYNNGLASDANNNGIFGHCFIPVASALDLQNQGYGSSDNYLSNNMLYDIDAEIQNPGTLGGNTLSTPSLSPFKAVVTYSSDCGSSSVTCGSTAQDLLYLIDYPVQVETEGSQWNDWHEGTESNQAEAFIYREIANSTTLPTCNNSTLSPCQNPLIISGPSQICVGSSGTFNVAPTRPPTDPSDINYTWSVPTGLSITSGNLTNQATIQGATQGQYQISVTAKNSCAETDTYNYTLTVAGTPNPPTSMNGVTNGEQLASNTTYTINAITNVQGVTGYNWIVEDGSILSGQGTSKITYKTPTVPNGQSMTWDIWVDETTSCGTSSYLEYSGEVKTNGGLGGVAVAPNPASNSVTVSLINNNSSTAQTVEENAVTASTGIVKPQGPALKTIEIYTEVGTKIKGINYSSGEQMVSINTADLTSGVYFIKVYTTADSAPVTQKLVILH